MKSISSVVLRKPVLISMLVDISALAFIYFVPAISHLTGLPLYFTEPMRLMLVLALVHTSKRNAYILALTMPLFSFAVSGHPELPKMLLIAFELSLSVFLFCLLVKKMKYPFLAIFMSIIASKAAYYIIKFALLRLAVISTELFTTPVYIQIFMTLVFSLYLYKFYRRS